MKMTLDHLAATYSKDIDEVWISSVQFDKLVARTKGLEIRAAPDCIAVCTYAGLHIRVLSFVADGKAALYKDGKFIGLVDIEE